MKKAIIATLAVLIVMCAGTMAFAKTAGTSSGTSEAGDFEIDGSFAFATGPGDFDSGYGLNFGAGYTLSAIDKNLQVRADLSYFDFSYSYDLYGYDLSYTRVPFTVSGRYYFPVIDRLKVFAQAGLEMSIDNFDYVDVFGDKHSKSEVNLGISPGVGVDYLINRNLSVFAVGRWHLISDSYFSMQFGAAYHF